MADNIGNENLTESVEELRIKLEAMKRIMEDNEMGSPKYGKRKRSCKQSVIDGRFLSIVFVIALLLIIFVSVYAFVNLYYAILKKFPGKPHTEL